MISLEKAIEQTNIEISTILNRVVGNLNEVTSYLNQSRGQGVRTHLLLLCATNNDNLISPLAPKVASAIELLHLATLLHDDVIDDAPLRRGLPSVQSKFGKKEAVLVGDYLLCLALSLIANLKMDKEDQETFSGLLPHFSTALSSVCTGEFDQHRQKANLSLNLFGYLKIIRGKTAALFYLSAYLGGLLAKENPRVMRSLGRMGRQIGLVFQILDDCKDYSMTEQKAGKPVASDLLNGVITLPLIMALKEQPSLLLWANEVLDGDNKNLANLTQIVQQVGVQQAGKIAHQYIKKASANLSLVKPLKAQNITNYLEQFL